MSDFGVVLESGTVRFERLLPGPVERVWSYLTDSEKRGQWLASGPFELRLIRPPSTPEASNWRRAASAAGRVSKMPATARKAMAGSRPKSG